MKRIINSTLLLFITAMLCSAFTIDLENNSGSTPNWLSIQEAYNKSRRSPKKVVIDVYTNWCGWCKKMDKSTFRQPSIVKYMNDNFYAVKLNAEMKETVTIDGEEYRYISKGRSGAHEIALLLLDSRMSFPTTVVLDEKFNRLSVIPGFLDAETMDMVLRYFGDGHQERGISWPAYEAKFKSKNNSGSKKRGRRGLR